MQRVLNILIAGVGNVLRQDDGFGIEVVRRLEPRSFSDGLKVTVLEAGTGGIHIVQALQEGYDVLILIDAVQRGGEPAELYFGEVDVADLTTMPAREQRDFLADMHYTNPMRALMLAKALGIMPVRVYLLGCEAVRTDDFAMGLSPDVESAIPRALERLEDALAALRRTMPTMP